MVVILLAISRGNIILLWLGELVKLVREGLVYITIVAIMIREVGGGWNSSKDEAIYNH